MSKIKAKADKICEIRILKGLSARELADKAGLSEFGLKQIENCKTNSPRAKTAKQIADALEVEFKDLFEIVES